MSEAPAPAELRRRWEVTGYDTDSSGLASFAALLSRLQEAAGDHAEHLGLGFADLARAGQLWVLFQFYGQVLRYPARGEELEIHTWPSGRQKLLAVRDFAIRDSRGDTVVRAGSAWMVIDSESRKPVRPDRVVGLVDIPLRDEQLAVPDRLRDHADLSPCYTRTVRYTDLDVNRHVNNVQYLRWFLDAIPLAWHDSGHVDRFHLTFAQEGRYGDRVSVLADPPLGGESPVSADPEGALPNGLMPKEATQIMLAAVTDEAVLARAELNWRPGARPQ